MKYTYKTVDDNGIVTRELTTKFGTYVELELGLLQTKDLILSVQDADGMTVTGSWSKRDQLDSDVLHAIITNINMEHDEPEVPYTHKLGVVDTELPLVFRQIHTGGYELKFEFDDCMQAVFVEYIVKTMYYGHTCYIVDTQLNEYTVSNGKISNDGFEVLDISLVLFRPILTIL